MPHDLFKFPPELELEFGAAEYEYAANVQTYKKSRAEACYQNSK